MRAEGRGQRAEGRGQRTEGRGQRAVGRGQRAEGSGQWAEGRGQRAEVEAGMQLLGKSFVSKLVQAYSGGSGLITLKANTVAYKLSEASLS